MKVAVTVFGILRDRLPEDSPGNRVVVELTEGATVAEVAAALEVPPGAIFACLVDGQPADPSASVGEGSEVTLMPPFTGGADLGRE